jgi:hypothetical protein
MLGEERKNIKENLKNKMMKSDIEGSVKIEKKTQRINSLLNIDSAKSKKIALMTGNEKSRT